MRTKRSHEGYLLLDNRNSEGVPDEIVHQHGLPVGAGKGMFETPTFTCNHCGGVVIMNPQRTRERAYCRGCDHYLCDGCGAERSLTGKCVTLQQKFDEHLAKVS